MNGCLGWGVWVSSAVLPGSPLCAHMTSPLEVLRHLGSRFSMDASRGSGQGWAVSLHVLQCPEPGGKALPLVRGLEWAARIPSQPQGEHSPGGPRQVGTGVQRSRNFTWQELTTMLSLGLRLRVLTMPGA